MIACLVLVLSSIQVRLYLSKVFRKWLFYLVILLFLGGIIVIFSYIASLSRKRKPNLKHFKVSSFSLRVLIFIALFYRVNTSFIGGFYPALSNIYKVSANLAILFLISYLLILLLACLKFLSFNKGTIKNFFNDKV